MSKYFRTNHIYAIMAYFIGMLVGLLVGMLFCMMLSSYIYGINAHDAIALTKNTKEQLAILTDNERNCYYFVQAYENFFSYVFMVLFTTLFTYGFLKEDFIKIKENKKKFFISLSFAAIGVCLLVGISFLFDFIVKALGGSKSQNQTSIADMILNGRAVIIFISIFFLAPFVEELIYRKCIFSFFKKDSHVLPILVSSLCFALPHMLASEKSFIVWLMLFLSYFLSGAVLSTVYELSGRNVYVSMVCHMLNNLFAFILIFI